jgi:predicted dithiol-disulfide oxidoreductase (DUF899 family)
MMKEDNMDRHRIVSDQEWLAARRELLGKEKELTRLRDELGRARRGLPWRRIDKSYLFDAPEGKQSLADLFEGRSQLIVQHFMFDPSWEAGCKSCSFWADGFDGIPIHLKHRDVTFVAVSKAPLAKLEAFKQRMGWSFRWVSSFGTDFNRDFHVSFDADELERGEAEYNFGRIGGDYPSEMPGVSVFAKDDAGNVFHTYSCYARGLDILNPAYHYLDLVPKGRDEADLSFSMAWVRLHDEYEA